MDFTRMKKSQSHNHSKNHNASRNQRKLSMYFTNILPAMKLRKNSVPLTKNVKLQQARAGGVAAHTPAA